MTSLFDSFQTLGHVQGGVMIAVMMFATIAGFVAGMIFERTIARQKQDDEK